MKRFLLFIFTLFANYQTLFGASEEPSIDDITSQMGQLGLQKHENKCKKPKRNKRHRAGKPYSTQSKLTRLKEKASQNRQLEALFEAIEEQDWIAAQMLINAEVNVNALFDNTGDSDFIIRETPLMFVVRESLSNGFTDDRQSLMKILLAGGADINKRDHYNNTPLQEVLNSDEERDENWENLLRFLLKKGAKPNFPVDPSSKRTIFEQSFREDDIQALEIMLHENAVPQMLLEEAALLPKSPEMQRLFDTYEIMPPATMNW